MRLAHVPSARTQLGVVLEGVPVGEYRQRYARSGEPGADRIQTGNELARVTTEPLAEAFFVARGLGRQAPQAGESKSLHG